MKTIILGDIHGYNALPILKHWEDADKIILLGDYLDSYDPIDPIQQIENAKTIFEFVDSHPNMVTLLGNHDLHYILPNEQSSRRFRGDALEYAQRLMTERYLANKLKWMYQFDDFTCSHAGITNTWWDKVRCYSGDELDLRCLGYYPKDESYYGANIHQGPCWIRPCWSIRPLYRKMGYFSGLEDDSWSNTKYQIVGHTQCDQIFIANNIVFCDCLSTEHVLVEDSTIFAVDSNTFVERII